MTRHKSVPLYRLHKPSNRAVVTLTNFGRRKDFYLGPYGSSESRREYARIIQEWETSGQRHPDVGEKFKSDLTIREILAVYWKWALTRYVKEGKPTSEIGAVRQALRYVEELYGSTIAREFGPLALKAVRSAMVKHKITRKVKQTDPETGEVRLVDKVIREGLARRLINKQIIRIKSFFKWCVAEELIPPSTFQALNCVAGLRKGEAGARETSPVRPVADDAVNTALPFMPKMVADLVRLQRLTGARPGEILQLRAADFDMTGAVWEFRPGRHKNEHHDRERIIFLGPQAQAILKKYLTMELTAPLFRPELSEEKRNTERRQSRKTTLTPSAKKRRARQKPRGNAGEQYCVAAYRRAITRACEKANIPAWTPHQLRHSAATEVRKRFGVEAAQTVLGHAELGVTQIYAERDLETARRVMAEIG